MDLNTERIINLKLFKINSHLIGVFLAFSEFIYFLIQSRWDPDPYHDGFVYVQALASSQGKLPNRDFLAIYGPLNPVIQGIWLNLVNNSLLSLRIFTSIILCLTGLLIYAGIKKYFGNSISVLISLIWAIGNPLTTTPVLPWPNIILSLLLVVSIFLISGNNQGKVNNYFYVAILVTLGIFVRNVSIISLLLILFTIYLKKENQKKILISFISGVSITLLFLFLLMVRFQLWDDFYLQTIKYGFSLSHKDRNIRGVVNFRIVLFGVLFIFLCTILRDFHIKSKKSATIKIANFLLTGTLALTILYSGTLQISRNQNDAATLSFYHNIKLFMENIAYTPLYFFVFACIIIFIRNILPKFNLNQKTNFTILAIALSSLTQLYPGAHAARIWFTLPVLIIGTAPSINEYLGSKKIEYLAASKYILIPTLISYLIVFNNQAHLPRIAYSNQVLAGMQGDARKVIPIDATLFNLEKFGIVGEIEFRCPIAIYSIAGKKYMSIDNYYVTLIPPLIHQQKLAKQIFFCDQNQPIRELFDNNSYRVVFMNAAEYPHVNKVNFLIERK